MADSGNRGDRQDNREGNRGDRQDNREGNRGDRQDNREGNRGDRQDNRQNNRDDIRNDWQDNWDNNNWYHDDWCHGHWNGGAWDHIWDNYPVAAALGLTAWGVNSMSYLFGYYPYTNPYYVSEPAVVYNYSEPLVVYDSPPVEAAAQPATAPDSTATAAADSPPPLPPGVSQAGLDTFDQARDAFYKNDYAGSLKLVDKSLQSMPKDAAIHEFRSLVLFALGKYPEAASTIYAVLAVGPGWDWTTMSSMYPDVETYTEQLRKLEAYIKANAGSSAARFLLAYHYITMGHKDAAATELKKVVELSPENNVAREMLAMVAGPDAVPGGATPKPSKTTAPPPSAMEIVGDWSASANNGKFQMSLTDDGKFTWAYDKDGKRQEVKGVYALEGNSLAMEPDAGGTMLAEVSKDGNSGLRFAMVGAPPGDPGLEFKR